MEVCSLSSGSSGNSFFVKANGSSFLVDAGISRKQVVEKLSSIGYDIGDINGIFITHAHADHVRGVDVLSRHHDIPVFATQGTYERFSHLLKNKDAVNFITANQKFNIGDVEIFPFSKSHDCADPVSYSITYNGRTASILTDIGFACGNVRDAVSNSNILCMEANHDLEMLQNGPYPYYLKQRIAGNYGHLSNLDASLLVLEHASPELKHIVLSHLSAVNNTPETALQAFNILRERKDIRARCEAAPRYDVTDIFSV